MESVLAALQPKQVALVLQIDLSSVEAGSLRRMGLIPGTKICCLQISPFGDPMLFRFRGTDAALRRQTAARILVRILDEPGIKDKKGGEEQWHIR